MPPCAGAAAVGLGSLLIFGPTAVSADTVAGGSSPTPAASIALGKSLGLFAPGETLSWRVTLPQASTTQRIFWRIVDAGGHEVVRSSPLSQSLIELPRATPGYYELIVEAGGATSAAAKSSAIVLARPARWSPGGNPFGGQAPLLTEHPSDSEVVRFYSRLGLTWDRPLFYNIVTGSHSDLPTDLAAYADAWALKARAGFPTLDLNTVEVWNEPFSNELHGKGTVAQYVAMVRATRRGLKQTDPTARIADNFDGSFDDYATCGGVGAMDISTIHPYSPFIYADPPSSHGPEFSGLLDILKGRFEQLRDAGIGPVEVWSTEFGWPTHPGYGWTTSELNQARYTVRSAVLQLAAGLKRVNPYRLTDVPFWGDLDGSFGMIRADGSPRPSLCAYAVLAQTVDNLPYSGQARLGANIAAFVFGDSAHSVIAAWNPTATAGAALHLRVGRTGAVMVGLFGHRQPLHAGENTVSLGLSPIYIAMTGSPSDCAAALGAPLHQGAPVDVFFPALSPNLFVDPGFEQGSSAWVAAGADSDHEITVRGLRGSQARSGRFAVVATASHSANPSWFGVSQSAIPVVGGGVYDFSAWVRADNVSGKCGWYVHVDGDRPMIVNQVLDAGPGTYGWRRIRQRLAIPVGGRVLTAGTVLYGSGCAYYDDASLTRIAPEPR